MARWFFCGTAFELNTDFFSLPPPNEGPPEKGTRVYDGFTNGSWVMAIFSSKPLKCLYIICNSVQKCSKKYISLYCLSVYANQQKNHQTKIHTMVHKTFCRAHWIQTLGGSNMAFPKLYSKASITITAIIIMKAMYHHRPNGVLALWSWNPKNNCCFFIFT